MSGLLHDLMVRAALTLHDPALWLGAGLIVLTAAPVFLSRNPVIKARWGTWVGIGVIAALAQVLGIWGATGLAILISLICISEYVRIVQLTGVNRWLLIGAGVCYPLLNLFDNPRLVPVLALTLTAAFVLAMMWGDAADAAQRTLFTTFGVLWLAWAPAQLVRVNEHLVLLMRAVALTDVASWAGGKTLGQLPGLRWHPFPISPNKTLGGLAGGFVGAAVALLATGVFSWPLLGLIGFGAPAGDLLASMFKRHAGVKDAGTIVPGFGGLLDRADSLLVVAPLLATFAATEFL